MTKVVEIQKALAKLGMKPGPLDGVWGRQTIAALRIFQTSAGLDPDGIAGPLTLKALFPSDKTIGDGNQTVLSWYKEAQRLIGTTGVPGKKSNPLILDWATDINVMYESDDIPWCGLFMGHCIGSTLDRESLPTNLLRARAWSRFGIPTSPTLGAVMVFWRKSPQSGLGHVGFYTGEDKHAYRILGGNQSNSVSLAWISKDRFLASRWPATVPPPTTLEIVTAGRDDSMSWDEV